MIAVDKRSVNKAWLVSLPISLSTIREHESDSKPTFTARLC